MLGGMPPFRQPTFDYHLDVDRELRALRKYSSLPGKEDRQIPERGEDRLLVATWNIANLGVQKREDDHYRLLAEIVGWFDLIALQEVNDNLVGLRAIIEHLPSRYRVLFNDAGGNDERFAFVYDSRKVGVREEIGELTVAAKDLPKVKLKDIPARFVGFDRNPMLASFRVNDMDLVLAGVHLYFGDSRPPGLPDDEAEATTTNPAARARAEQRKEPPPAAGMDRRVLEAFAVARWAEQRERNENAYTANVIALGDYNLPVQAPGDRVYDALTKKGLRLPPHSTRVGGSNINDDAHYDQMAVLPGAIHDAIEELGIFDFDGALFADLFGGGTKAEVKRFREYMRYYVSDHRPLWMSLKL
ncbi:MAG: hypothetical protein QOK00_1136 [Thermoleophilaceae bacterium]|nr:hypothetical protein [Thermoleophilaceae bacterium]